MGNFRYKARGESGKVLAGTLEAPSEEAVIRHLEEMGYTPISVRKEFGGTKQETSGLFQRFEKVKEKDLVMMTRQMHSLILAGIPIMTALDILEKQIESVSLKKILSQVQEDIAGGTSFSEALKKFPRVFSDLYVNTVMAGEAAGSLPEVLERLALLLESEQETKKSVKSAVRYPMIAVFVMIGAFFILTTMVIPKFSQIFARMGTELPLPTRILMGMSEVINKYYYIIFPSIAAALFAFYRFSKTKYGRYQIDKAKLKMPIFGPLFIKLAMFRFSKMLATLERSGVPILKIIEIVSLTVGNVIIGDDLKSLRDEVKDGKGISSSLLKKPVFPPMVSSMLSVGEETGKLDEMAESIAYYYDQEIKYMVATLTDLIEPLLTLFIAAGVLLFALAIFLPMWNMIEMAKR